MKNLIQGNNRRTNLRDKIGPSLPEPEIYGNESNYIDKNELGQNVKTHTGIAGWSNMNTTRAYWLIIMKFQIVYLIVLFKSGRAIE